MKNLLFANYWAGVLLALIGIGILVPGTFLYYEKASFIGIGVLVYGLGVVAGNYYILMREWKRAIQDTNDENEGGGN